MTHIAGNPVDFDSNPFTKYASSVSPIDEAKALPLIFQNLANGMGDGMCRRLFSDKSVQAAVISGAHDQFTKTVDPKATDWQGQLRHLMRDHLCFQSLGGLEGLSEFGPSLSDEPPASTRIGRVLEWCFPKLRRARIDMLNVTKRIEADKQVEELVAKFVIVRASVVAAMFDQVIKATAEKAQAA